MTVRRLVGVLRDGEPIWESGGGWWSLYVDWRDWWIGFYVSDTAVYVIFPIPCLVLRRMRG